MATCRYSLLALVYAVQKDINDTDNKSKKLLRNTMTDQASDDYALAVIFFSDIFRQNKAKGGGICVANHTSPIDAIILACDNCYALVRRLFRSRNYCVLLLFNS